MLKSDARLVCSLGVLTAGEGGGREENGAERGAPEQAAGGRAIAVDGSRVFARCAVVLLLLLFAQVVDGICLSFRRAVGAGTESVQKRRGDRLAHVVFEEELLEAAPLTRICVTHTTTTSALIQTVVA